MECMRSLVAKDRHVEGYWTRYSPSLERAVLKKLKYLDETPRLPAPAPSSAPTLEAPKREPKEQPVLQPVASPFAEKLQQAWRKES